MKKIITAALGLVLFAGAVQAQSTEGKRGHHKQQHSAVYNDLNLTADQKTRIQAIHESYRKRSEELRKQDQLSVADMKNRRRELHQQQQAEIQSVLTREQKDGLARKHSERIRKGKEGRAEGKRDGTGKGRGADLSKELDLSPDQQTRMNTIRSDYRTRFKALQSDATLSPEQKKNRRQELAKAQGEAMKAVLTPEQSRKMESYRQNRKSRNTK